MENVIWRLVILVQFVIASIDSVEFGTVTSAPCAVLNLVLLKVISSTDPVTVDVSTQSPIVNGFSVIIIIPPKKLLMVSFAASAKASPPRPRRYKSVDIIIEFLSDHTDTERNDHKTEQFG